MKTGQKSCNSTSTIDDKPLELIAELIADLVELSSYPSKEFMKFAEITFTNKKADPKHNHSFNSYLLRIPIRLILNVLIEVKILELRLFKDLIL